MTLRRTAVALALLLVPVVAFAQATRPAGPVTVTNDASNPVPVSVTNAVTVRNTAATPLFVSSAAASSPATRLLFSETQVIMQPGTVQVASLDVSTCSTIRAAVKTEFAGDTFVVSVDADEGVQLDQYIVGTVLGGTTTNVSRVYETPGLVASISLTPQNLPTGLPVTVAVWCR